MWIVSLTSTFIFNLDLGLAVAVVFSLVTLLYRTQQSVNVILQTLHGAFWTKRKKKITVFILEWKSKSPCQHLLCFHKVIASHTFIWFKWFHCLFLSPLRTQDDLCTHQYSPLSLSHFSSCPHLPAPPPLFWVTFLVQTVTEMWSSTLR